MSDARHAFTAQIIKDRKTTVRDVLASDFGHFPPKGLDILVAPEQPIEISSMLGLVSKETTFSLLSFAHSAIPMSTIRFEDLPKWIQTISHYITISEFIIKSARHIFSHSTSFVTAPAGRARILRYNPFHTKKEDYPNTVSESVISLMQNADILRNNFRVSTSHPLFKDDPNLVCADKEAARFLGRNNLPPSIFKPIVDPSTLQSSLHIVLAAGYREWGKMPTNRFEFLTAMQSLGLCLSTSVETIQPSAAQKAKIRKSFFKPKHLSKDERASIHHINSVLDSCKTLDQYDDFCETFLPRLYGNLLELYGDRLGRERMGYGKNTKWTGSWLNLLRENAGDAYDIHTVLRWSGQLDTKDAFKALARLVATPITMALPNDELIASALFARKDLADYAATKLPDLVMEACANANEPMASGLMNWLCEAVNDQKLKEFKPTDMAHRYAFKYGRHKRCLLPTPSAGVEVASKIETIGVSYFFYSQSRQRQKGMEPDPTILHIGSHCLSGIQNAKVKLQSFEAK